jgi:hypothetical protein
MKARDQDEEENQSNGEPPLPAVSANTLARCLGVTPKVIYDLTKEGVIERIVCADIANTFGGKRADRPELV